MLSMSQKVLLNQLKADNVRIKEVETTFHTLNNSVGCHYELIHTDSGFIRKINKRTAQSLIKRGLVEKEWNAVLSSRTMTEETRLYRVVLEQ